MVPLGDRSDPGVFAQVATQRYLICTSCAKRECSGFVQFGRSRVVDGGSGKLMRIFFKFTSML
jgi:hypothetical protein